MIPLTTTPCNYGGERVWFVCPNCGDRRAGLFCVGGWFRCRVCHDLAYSSTREDAFSRSCRRCGVLQAKLGLTERYGVPVWTIPPKPKGMHWETYDRFVRELCRVQGLNGILLDTALDQMAARVAQWEAGKDVSPE